MEERTQVLQHRQEKLAELEALGITAFAYDFDRTHRTVEAIAAFEAAESGSELNEDGHGPGVSVGGRIVGRRGHGRTEFAHVEDGRGRIQLYLRKDVLGDESFGRLGLLDTGDWVGVGGPTFRTRTGEVTILVQSWTLLTKSLRPLPYAKQEYDAEAGD